MSPASSQPQLVVDNVPADRQPRRPTLFLPGFLNVEEFPTLDALALRLQALAGPWPISFCAGAAAYPGFDTFASVTAYAGGHYLATVAIPGRTADDLRAACRGHHGGLSPAIAPQQAAQGTAGA